jgi:ABC-2 type transport system permease protein
MNIRSMLYKAARLMGVTNVEFREGIAEDSEHGVIDRLLSLPVSRTAMLTGRVLAETAMLVVSLAITTTIGFVVGFRVQGSIVGALAASGLIVAFGFAFMWVFTWMGQVAGNAQSAEGMSMMIFPVSFVSSAMVPVDTMPGWMQPIAENQPVTVMVNAVRSLVLGDPGTAGLDHGTGHWVALALAWTVGITAVFAPLAVAKFRRSS